ncbi:MAG: hypothetical protein ACQRW7_13360 [Caulobacterales bacterium]|uniref:hypothetical protein n=1 Tax=Glycocaulis sp. TaxID=1969725 RepID=UPI003F9EE4C2
MAQGRGQGISRPHLIFVAALGLLVTACATQEGYRQRAALHIGHTSDSLIIERGSPVSRDYLSDGGEVWTYFVSEQRHDPGGYSTIPRERRVIWVDQQGREHVRIEQYEETVYNPPRTWTVECETRFIISPDGIVRDFRFDGAACVAPELES